MTAGQSLVWFGSTVVLMIVAWVRTDSRSPLQWLPPTLVLVASVALLAVATHI